MGAPSQAGGVFGGPLQAQPRSDGFGRNMGRSSVKGGIFGTSQQDAFLARLERTEQYEKMPVQPARIGKADAIKAAAINNPITLDNWAARSKAVGRLHVENERREMEAKERIAAAAAGKEMGQGQSAAAMQRRNLTGQGQTIDREMAQMQQQQMHEQQHHQRQQQQQQQQMQMQQQQQQQQQRQQQQQQQQRQQQQPDFLPSARFQGSQPGMVFKAGRNGVGYYRDQMGGLPSMGEQQRSSTRVVAPPGGASSISFGTHGNDATHYAASPARMQTGNGERPAAGGRARSAGYDRYANPIY